MSQQIITQGFTNGVSKEETERTEVVAKASRRRFSTKYKLRILAEIDECRFKRIRRSSKSQFYRRREHGALTPTAMGGRQIALQHFIP